MMRWGYLSVALLLAAGLLYAGHRAYVRRSAPTASDGMREQEDLRHLMQTKVHEEYTRVSFTIWHDQPLTAAKMEAIAVASAHIAGVAQELEAYEAAYREQGWSPQDVSLFGEHRRQLARVAGELSSAARSHDETLVVNSFKHLDETCQGCHQRFRRDLAWNQPGTSTAPR